MATQKAMNPCDAVSRTPVVLGSKELDWKTAVSVCTTSSAIHLQEAPGQAVHVLCIHYSQLFTGISRLLSVLTCELRKQDGHPANEAAGRLLTRSHPLKTCPSPRSLHPARPQDRAVPSMSALTTRAQVGRLCPLHANLELPMNTSKPWILIHKLTQTHKFTIF